MKILKIEEAGQLPIGVDDALVDAISIIVEDGTKYGEWKTGTAKKGDELTHRVIKDVSYFEEDNIDKVTFTYYVASYTATAPATITEQELISYLESWAIEIENTKISNANMPPVIPPEVSPELKALEGEEI